MVHNRRQERQVVTNAFDLKAVQRVAHHFDGFGTGRGPCAQLGNHRVVVHRNLAALVDAGIVTHDASTQFAFCRRTVACQTADGRQEVAVRVFGIQTVFNRPAVDLHVVLRDRQRFAICNADHLFNQIDAGDQFGHRVFHLKTRVHLEEVEVPVTIDDEFHSTRAGVAHCLRQSDRLFAHRLTCSFVKERRRRFFDNLLVPALDRTFAFVQVDAVAMGIRQNLNFDVARLGDEFLDKDTVIAKRRRRFVFGRLEAFTRFFVVPRDPHALTAATGRGLDHHRIADLVRDFDGFIGVFDQTHVTGNGADARFLRDFLGRDLVAHCFNRFDRRAYECHTFGFQRLCELGVFRQETIARVNGLCAGLTDGIHDLVDHDVRLVCGRRADVYGFIGHLHVKRGFVSIRI